MAATPSYLFYCKTPEGYIIKILAELLQNNIKNGCFLISPAGVMFRMTDSNRKTLIDLEMQSDNFTQYKFKSADVMSIGLNFSHLYKMVKTVKKKDSIILFIEEGKETDLGIKVITKEKSRVTTSSVKIQNLQSLDIEMPSGYQDSIIVPSNEYMKMVKDLNNMGGHSLSIATTPNTINFSCQSNGVYSRNITFGEADVEDSEFKATSQEFEMEQLSRIAKVAGLSTQLHICQMEGMPIQFKSNVGNLGKICIYVKDKSLQEAGIASE